MFMKQMQYRCESKVVYQTSGRFYGFNFIIWRKQLIVNKIKNCKNIKLRNTADVKTFKKLTKSAECADNGGIKSIGYVRCLMPAHSYRSPCVLHQVI